MSQFIHHPDGYVVFDQAIIPKAVWAILEPSYSLPPGAVGRIFSPGEKHHLIMVGNGKHTQVDINDATLTAYIGKKAEYITARDAYNAGAAISNEGGEIVIQAIDSLTCVPSTIDTNGVAEATITCLVGDANYAGAITWTVKAPDGTIETTPDTFSGGSATLTVTTTQEGTHTVKAVTEDYGHKSAIFEGVTNA